MSPILVAIALVFHLFPFRTEKLSPTAPMVLRKRESRSPPSFPKVRVPSPVIRGRDAFLACSGRDGRSSFPMYCPFSAHPGEGRFFMCWLCPGHHLLSLELHLLSFELRRFSLVANKRLRSGLKAQQAHSPGHRPGYVYRRKCALKGQKHWYEPHVF